MSDFNPFPGSPIGDERRVFIPTPSSSTPDAPPRPRSRPASPQQPGAYRQDPPSPPPWRQPGGPGGPNVRPAPPGRGPRKPWFRRIRWRWVVLGFAMLWIVLLVGGYLWANSIFNRIERVEVAEALSSEGSGTNYLIVGSDSRDGGPEGNRADTIMVLHFDGDGAKVLSVPRDLYVPIAGTDEQQKINAAYNGGPTRLVQTVSEYLQIPINRYMEVDFVSFAGLVDALGGVTINFPNPASDINSGLNVTETGPVELDGQQALAYVRSRHYVETINGEQVEDPTADLGRIQRQQAFMKAVFDKLGSTRNPFTLSATASNLADGLRIDDKMTMFDGIRLFWRLRGLQPQPQELPVDADSNESGSVLILREEEAQAVLEQFR